MPKCSPPSWASPCNVSAHERIYASRFNWVGSPAGYVGYEDGGLLTDAIRKTPNCVLLLDEIEKAHPDVFNILLQVMDYAVLTDNKGRKADCCRHVVLIMTSNAEQYARQASSAPTVRSPPGFC